MHVTDDDGVGVGALKTKNGRFKDKTERLID